MDDSWAIYIDIEGFSALYTKMKGDAAIWGLRKLMIAVHRIGKYVFPEPPERLFAYQTGDGFLIVSDFHESNLDRAASIAVVIMKFITSFGIFARATIAEGGIAGITGCYAKEVLNDSCDGDTSVVSMGRGLMTIFPVMGTALINSIGLDKRAPKGPMLILPATFRERLSSNILSHNIEDTSNIAIDWIHTDGDLINEIKTKDKLQFPIPNNLESLLKNYIAKHNPPVEWICSCYYMGVDNT
jgi:hypothetical protein